MCGPGNTQSSLGGFLHEVGDPANLFGKAFGNKTANFLADPLNIFGSGPSTAMTPQEIAAYNAAQPFLAEYNSGTLNSANQALVNQADTNATESAAQSFANAGMTNSSSAMATIGTVTPGTIKGNVATGVQAGAGSGIDLVKASNTQQILQSDLNNALAYLGVASGDAQALSAVNLQANENIAASLQQASKSFGTIAGSPGSTSGFNMNAFAQFMEGMTNTNAGGTT